jgi:hypothetical protein
VVDIVRQVCYNRIIGTRGTNRKERKMTYELIDSFEGLLCECGNFATTREVNTFGNEVSDLCDKCLMTAFNLG